MMLDLLVEELEPKRARRLDLRHPRRPALFAISSRASRRIDPLTEAAREAGGGEHRFGQHGDLLDDWIAPLFDDTAGDAPASPRLLPACRRRVAGQPRLPRRPRSRNGASRQLGRGDPRRPRDHGAGAVVQLRPRPTARPASSPNCATTTSLSARTEWGLAMRLGQRLSGGVASVLRRTRLSTMTGVVRLGVRAGRGSADRRSGRAAPASRSPRRWAAKPRSSAPCRVAFRRPR